LADASDGILTWENPSDVETFINKDAVAKATEAVMAEEAAIAEGILDEKPLQREDFMTDDELLQEVLETPGGRPPIP
jgi:hypothetical protein